MCCRRVRPQNGRRCPDFNIWWYDSGSENLETEKYSFIAIIHIAKFTLTRIGSTFLDPNSESSDQFENYLYLIGLGAKNTLKK